ncbi:MAG: LysM peptidoglycan-binding domain-containing protein [Calditrichaceae bacterium]|nr:LysM peptidoglycan-binding domain-containing protein [Calditrichia bacterium]NUQ40130.1 LysM peptidoglycan-binding domain-containing protein [Calditrichaceae bacterium]
MKQYLILLLLTIILIFNWGCNRLIFKEQPPESPPPQSEALPEQDLQTAASYLDLAENPSEAGDSLNPEYYYLHALEVLDSLSAIYGEDSSLTALRRQVTLSFDDYLNQGAPETGEAGDTLTADMVMEDLSDIYSEENGSAAFFTDSLQTLARDSIPIVLNSTVEKTIRYFTNGKGRKVFNTWLRRAGRYETMVKSILREEGVPEELFYLAMIESGLNPAARSYARAVGMWQFIAATGRAYGLNQSWWYDDRRDVAKASRAAARHLRDLYQRFGDWNLAIAGYNFNPNKIEKRMNQYNVSEFWELPRLPRQTRSYVPTYLAAVTIAKNPEQYGFEIVPEEPVQFDTVTVRECVDLNVVAEAIGSSFKELKDLNPALLRWCTPPDVEKWVLNLPPRTRETFAAKYDELPKEKKVSWLHHRIRQGETLSTIARKYDVSMSEIQRINRLKGTMIRAGGDLVIPIPQGKEHYQKYIASEKPQPRKSSGATARKAPAPARQPLAEVKGRERHLYIVKKGDSLWDIAMAHNLTVSDIREWNGLEYTRLIKPGQELILWLPQDGAPQNGRSGAAPKQPETLLAQAEREPLPSPSTSGGGNGRETVHTVRSGETLWNIAQEYEVSISDLKRWNGKRSNTIHPGEELKILK